MYSYFERSQDSLKRVTVTVGPDFSFPSHFHRKIEIFTLTKGNYTVLRNGRKFFLSPGDIIVFDSFDIHSYGHNESNAEGLVIIIPPNAAEKFFTRKNSKKINNPLISDTELCNTIYKLGKKFIVPEKTDETIKTGAAELILALIEPKLDLKDTGSNDETTLAQNLLFYINQNFSGDISLRILAKKFGYTQEHISRVFNRYLNMKLPQYVNGLRLDYMDNALKNGTTENITSLLFSAGFKSIQTYYRAKSKRDKITK